MVAEIVRCLISFALGGLCTVAVLHRDIFKISRINRIEMEMINALLKDSGDGRGIDGISQDIIDIHSIYSSTMGPGGSGLPIGEVDIGEDGKYKIPE